MSVSASPSSGNAGTVAVDVLVVGSGPVGSTFARVLHDTDSSLSILMVEAGPKIATPLGRHVKTITDPEALIRAQVASQGPENYPHLTGSGTSRGGEKDPVVARPGTFLVGTSAVQDGEDGLPAAAMSMNVGGMGSHWTCACPRPGEGERIEFIPRDEFDELFDTASRLLHVTQRGFDGVPLGAEVRQLLSRVVDDGRAPDRRVQPMPLALTLDADGRRYWTGPDVVLGDLAEGALDGFELRSDTLAVRILQSDGTATGAVLRHLRTGIEYTVAARFVVVAGDALRTPRLLHVSGIRPPALGHYLNDHPQVLGVVQLDDRFIPDGERPRKASIGHVDAMSGVNWIPYDRDTLPFHGQIMQMDASPVPIEGIEEPWPGSIVGIGFFCTKDIRFEDRVEFDEIRTDFLGQPEIDIHYTLTEHDRNTLREACMRIVELADALGHLVGDRPPLVMPPGSSMHYMGTTRMGAEDDGTSVCDPNGRVWGTTNVYVGGNGVIPTATAGNPTATSVALAVKSARHIAARVIASRSAAVA